ncbi:MAG: phosphoribosylformylglycinamidine synthase subunit PurL [Blastocatellales bacterium]|nr:phosphoribosylformylglycinamidine synthase subunit PurL [Blastocatellales bacterium]
MKITPEIIEQHNLTGDEYRRIEALLKRAPTFTELGIFSVMWSEHCSYKSSRIHLKRLPVEGDCLVQGPGENAGIVDIGDGWCAAFKIESHNHPSFIEPYQGAATGVGGILRDIFTMGARPVAALNSLRFGPVRDQDDSAEAAGSVIARNRRIMTGVVKGIGDYGNAFGVPTIGGEVVFADCYSLNPLVNAFALGLVRREQIFYGKAEGVGNAVIYVGAKTGRDGIHGATMASAEFDDAALEKRPTVQVGDPFAEKLLLEACLEAMRSGAIVGIQDMGAAGLTSSSCEMGARAGTGIEINLDLVPQRETGMTAYEMMLSESQERMLIVAERGRERQVHEIFARWDLDAVTIGRVTDDQKLRVVHKGEVVAEIPNSALTDEAPRYDRPQASGNEAVHVDPAPYLNEIHGRIAGEIGSSDLHDVLTECLRRLLASPNLACKQWVWRQYDHMVRTNTVVLPGADAAVIRVKETRRSLAVSLDGNGRYCSVDARAGARLAVVEAARNVVCSGARPLAVTNCLNFASPERPEVMRAFSETIDGMSDACRALGTPVTGGNVSFYNETEGRGVYPTPVVGMLGVIEDTRQITTPWFAEAGDRILLLGATGDDLGATEFLESLGGVVAGGVPQLDLEDELAVQRTCLRAISAGLLRSAHDCSDGGLAVALAECCFSHYRRDSLGARLDLREHLDLSGIRAMADADRRMLALLFGETPGRIIVSAAPDRADAVMALAAQEGADCAVIGEVGGDRLSISLGAHTLIDERVDALEKLWRESLPGHLDRVRLDER